MGTLALLAALAPLSLPLLGAPAAPDPSAGKPVLADASGSEWGVDYFARGGVVVDAIRMGQPPRGWGPNCYGEVDAALQWEAASGRAGSAALSLDCGAFRGGAAQAYLPIAPVQAKQTYMLPAWDRGEGLYAPLRLRNRGIGEPYTGYLGATARPQGT